MGDAVALIVLDTAVAVQQILGDRVGPFLPLAVCLNAIAFERDGLPGRWLGAAVLAARWESEV